DAGLVSELATIRELSRSGLNRNTQCCRFYGWCDIRSCGSRCWTSDQRDLINPGFILLWKTPGVRASPAKYMLCSLHLLAARKHNALFSHFIVVALRQGHNEVMSPAGLA